MNPQEKHSKSLAFRCQTLDYALSLAAQLCCILKCSEKLASRYTDSLSTQKSENGVC